MTPKSYSDVFAYLWVITGLPWGLGMAAILQEEVGFWVLSGAVFGLVMAFIGTPKLVGVTAAVPLNLPQDAATARLNIAAAQMGYAPASQTGGLIVYDATEGSSFTLGPIKIAPASYLRMWAQFEQARVTLIGPKKAIDDVQAKLSAQ